MIEKDWRVAIFASGTGSNAVRIIEYLRERYEGVRFTIFCNNEQAGVLEKARMLGVTAAVFNRQALAGGALQEAMEDMGIDLVVLAGFLWLVPPAMVKAFPNKIINIHPSLLPKHGGKGMYGMRVHEAVKASNDAETGITIHFVNERYDEGQIILQAKTAVLPTDTPEQVAKKVQALEHKHFPEVVERLLLGA